MNQKAAQARADLAFAQEQDAGPEKIRAMREVIIGLETACTGMSNDQAPLGQHCYCWWKGHGSCCACGRTQQAHL